MARYGKLLSSIWSDPEFTALDPHAQQLYCMLISHTTRNHAGVLPMVTRRWTRASAGVSIADVEAALDRLAAARFVVADRETDEVLIRTYVAHDASYKTPNSRKSLRDAARGVESDLVRVALSIELLKIDHHEVQEIGNELVEDIPQPLRQGLAQGLAQPKAQGCGDGYVSTVGASPSPSPSDHDHRPDHISRRRNGSELARRNFADIPSRSQRAIEISSAYAASRQSPPTADDLVAIGVQITKALDSGIDEHTIAAGLTDWDKSDSWSPNQIGRFITKAGRASPRPRSTVDDNVIGWLAMQEPDAPQEITG